MLRYRLLITNIRIPRSVRRIPILHKASFVIFKSLPNIIFDHVLIFADLNLINRYDFVLVCLLLTLIILIVEFPLERSFILVSRWLSIVDGAVSRQSILLARAFVWSLARSLIRVLWAGERVNICRFIHIN